MQSEPIEPRAGRERVEQGIYRRAGAGGKPRYEIAFRDSDGRQRRQVVEGGIKAARAALADVKAKMGKGQRVAPSPGLTFAEAAERWRTSQVQALRPATRAGYETALRVHLLPRWRRRRLDSIDVDDVARLIEDMRKAGRKAWTIRGVLTAASRVFEFARRRQGWAGENPVRRLDRSERPRSDQRERRVLDRGELTRLFVVADEPYRTVFAFAAGTGARLGETLGLKWRSFDLESGTASITHQLDRRGAYVELKTARSRRTVELPRELVAALSAHKLASSHLRSDDYVFASAIGGPLDHRNVAGRALARAAKAAGITTTEGKAAPTFHALRHGFASAWIADGGDLVELSAHLGHATPQVTATVYAHEFEKAARSDVRRARLDSIVGSTMAARNRRSAQESSDATPGQVVDMQGRREGTQ